MKIRITEEKKEIINEEEMGNWGKEKGLRVGMFGEREKW